MELKTTYQMKLDRIKDEETRSFVLELINLNEELLQLVKELRFQIQELRNEVSHLKGEQGKPVIKESKKKRLS